MTKIEWNKVTWYSKLLALVLFVGLPFLFFYYGIQYGETASYIRQTSATVTSGVTSTTTTPGGSVVAYYSNPAEWQSDSNNTQGGFAISYPIDFSATDNYSVAPSTDWRVNSGNVPGVQYFSLSVPSAFEPQTNFAGAILAVGASGNNVAVSNCMKPDQTGGPAVAPVATTTINGTTFTIFQSDSAGAGSEYDTTSYRTLHAGQCYAVEYTVHSSQIANYPSSYNLQPFNASAIDSLMQTIIGTFKFD